MNIKEQEFQNVLVELDELRQRASELYRVQGWTASLQQQVAAVE